MRLTKEFIIRDLVNYDLEINILELLGQCDLSVVIDLLKIGNKCTEEVAISILYKTLESMTLEQVVEKLAYEVIGREPSSTEENTSSKQFTSLTEILMSFYNSIQSADSNLTYTEFMSMSTKVMYRYADGVHERLINETNKKWNDMYMDKCMLGQMLAGKLKDCPKLNDDGSLHKDSLNDKIRKLKFGGV